ncbi:MAG: type II toxin-antitoxin system RelE/ParE family toxin [Treponema sp.]|nr:type II toxin-antitoxin system RelE/ParE family toxin [Treponema sp.]
MRLEFSEAARKAFKKIDKTMQKRIKEYLDEVLQLENPRSRGKALTGNLVNLWRYRVGDYRIICDIQDEKILITVLRLGHRKEIYDI